jgi:prolyl oligopeptidase
MSDDDPYLWLEDVEGDRALEWVRERNEESAVLAEGERFTALKDGIKKMLDSKERIPGLHWRGEYVYNLWKDEQNPRGLWRRTTVDGVRADEWQVLIDLDALAEAEGENWVWAGSTELKPENQRYLISLSRGGADAHVVREYDLETGFVPDGFELTEAKQWVSWIDLDTIFVSTDFGPGTLTTSGYPRVVKRWRRGTPLDDAEVVFEGQAGDVLVVARHDPTPGFERDLVDRAVTFFESEVYLLRTEGPVRIDVPADAVVDVHREWLLVRLRSPWTVASTTYPDGALLATVLEDHLAGERSMTVLFEPAPDVALSYHRWTRNHLILAQLRDVRRELVVLDPANGWRRDGLEGLNELSHTEVMDTNPDHTDEVLLVSTGFTEPPALRYGRINTKLDLIRSEPAFFDAEGILVRQHFATSRDGTRVPYFVVGPERADGPTLLEAYGGFEVSRTPTYDASVGLGWLTRGGTYVLANIRGGGEYGPAWHQAAKREHRHRAFEDLAAVAEDLMARGITEPSRLGVQGGSNGGLLMGVMLTRYPQLFGAIVGAVPLLDMRRYHRLPAGASWIAEYGDPDTDDWDFLARYSPYQNIQSGQKYPPVLWITSTRDDRVHPAHARKMTARLREHGYDVQLYENVEGGHGAAADNAQVAFREALAFEFLWQQLG